MVTVLEPVEPVVDPPQLQQLLMASLLADLAMVQDQNAVSVAQRR